MNLRNLVGWSVVACASAAMLCVSSAARAQVLVKPLVTATIIDPGPAGDPACGQQLVPMMVPDAWYAPSGAESASACANDLAAQIIAAKYANPSRLPDGMIRVWIFGWGNPTTTPDAAHVNWPTRLFRESDALPGLASSDFPHPLDTTARPYLHPFLLNAGFGLSTSNTMPLAQWTLEFSQAYKVRQAAELSGPDHRILPDPDAFWLDIEAPTVLGAPGDINGAFMFQWLYQHPTIWTTWEVPGYPAGTTLQTLYNAASPYYGFPVTPILDYNLGAADESMRPYMLFYYQILQHVVDHAVRVCASDVLKSEFHHCRISSYGDMRMDGDVDTTGWFYKRPDNNSTTFLPSRSYPRAWIDPMLGGWMWRHGTTLREYRWLAQAEVASGDADAPYLYPLADFQYDPGTDPQYSHIYPHKQVNIYDRLHRDETLPESSLRLHRMTGEPIINSNGGMHANRVVSWTAAAWSLSPTNPTEPPPRNWVTPDVLRRQYAMLRAKAVPEITNWTDQWDTREHGQPYAFQAWLETSRVVRDVWADHIDAVTIAYGTITPQTDNDRPAREEFTLRDAQGNDRTIDIVSDTTVIGTTANRTEMVVDFGGLNDCTAGEWSGILINLEHSTVEEYSTASQTIGLVLLWDWDSGRWHLARWRDRGEPTGQVLDSYGCYTPASALHTFENRQSMNVYLGGGQFINGDGVLRMKLVNFNPRPFTIRHDLVQAIPFNMPLCDCLLPPLPVSDKNYDSVVTSGDLAEFLAEWLAGKITADLNNDGVVDAADLTLYLAAFIEES